MAALAVIVPMLDEAEGIAAALIALAPLRQRGAEIIVVDGGSLDRSIELARPCADRVIVAPRGRAAQMNAGAAATDADLLLFLHADCRLPERADELVRNTLSDGRWQWGHFYVRIAGSHPLLSVIAAMMNRRSRLTGIATGDQALFMTRHVFTAAGGFPELPLMEDIAMSKRLKRIGRPRCLAAKVVASGRRWEQHGVVRTMLLMWRLRLAYFFGAEPTHGWPAATVTCRTMSDHIAIAVMARAPEPGHAKTRLIQALGAKGAADLQAKLIERSVATAAAAAIGPVTLWATPDESHPVFQDMRRRFAVALERQIDGDIGARMLGTFVAANHPTIVVGTDCPALTPDLLRDAADALRSYDAVLIPAEDGGYVLIGLHRPIPALFADIDWGTATVMAETRWLLSAHGLTWRELPPLWDVDTPKDLERLRDAGFPGLP